MGILGKGCFGLVYLAKAMDNGFCKYLATCLDLPSPLPLRQAIWGLT